MSFHRSWRILTCSNVPLTTFWKGLLTKYSPSVSGMQLHTDFCCRIACMHRTRMHSWLQSPPDHCPTTHLQKQQCAFADCEWRPSYRRGERNPVALLTIASQHHVTLIRLYRMYFRDGLLPATLMDFLCDGGCHFLGSGWSSDSSALEYSYGVPKEVRLAPKLHHLQITTQLLRDTPSIRSVSTTLPAPILRSRHDLEAVQSGLLLAAASLPNCPRLSCP